MTHIGDADALLFWLNIERHTLVCLLYSHRAMAIGPCMYLYINIGHLGNHGFPEPAAISMHLVFISNSIMISICNQYRVAGVSCCVQIYRVMMVHVLLWNRNPF